MTALATEIGRPTQTINAWKRQHRDHPRTLADGRHDADKWRQFIRDKGLNKEDEITADLDEDGELDLSGTKTKEELNCALIAQKIRRERIKADLESGKAVLVEDLETHLGALLSAVQNGCDSFPDRAAPMVQGFSDVPEIAKILHSEMQATIGQLQIADFENALEQVPEEHREHVRTALKAIGNFHLKRLTEQ